MQTSAVSGFSKMSLSEKIKIIKGFANLDKEDLAVIEKYQELPDFSELENNIGPFKIATNFLVNGKDYFVPMEVEEPSVVAAASRGAKLLRYGGGLIGEYIDSKMIGQFQIVNLKDLNLARREIEKNKKELLRIANKSNEFLFEIGGGAKDIEVREVMTGRGKNLVIHLLVDTKDAMGANIINTMLESISSRVIELTRGKPRLRIISNFADRRIVLVRGKIPIDKLEIGTYSGQEVAQGILDADSLARVDIYRASTHNKGIMNGIDAVAVATGNDWRAIEAGVHSYASVKGYSAITKWTLEGEFLQCKLEVPMPVAIRGGATKTRKARLALKLLRVETAKELGVLMVSVGLANNLAALSVLGTEGIQSGHMNLHENFVKNLE